MRIREDNIGLRQELASQGILLREVLNILREQQNQPASVTKTPMEKGSALRSPEAKSVVKATAPPTVVALKDVGAGYMLSESSNLGIFNLFCDYYEYNLQDKNSWGTKGREMNRCKGVVAYMIGQANRKQKDFLNSKKPRHNDNGKEWTQWHEKLKEISRDITAATMLALDAEEATYLKGKSKSKAGAKLIATVSAVDGRLSKVKAAKGSAPNLTGSVPFFAAPIHGTEAASGISVDSMHQSVEVSASVAKINFNSSSSVTASCSSSSSMSASSTSSSSICGTKRKL